MEALNKTMEAWHTLMYLQDEGKVRFIGVSNTYNPQMLSSLGEARKVQIVQNRWYEGNNWDKQVCDYCRIHSIHYQ
jgi:diketogulonate reductase-like aldo/keto reductase